MVEDRLLWKVGARGIRNDVCGIIETFTSFRADPILSTSDVAAVRRCTFAAPRGLCFARLGSWAYDDVH